MLWQAVIADGQLRSAGVLTRSNLDRPHALKSSGNSPDCPRAAAGTAALRSCQTASVTGSHSHHPRAGQGIARRTCPPNCRFLNSSGRFFNKCRFLNGLANGQCHFDPVRCGIPLWKCSIPRGKRSISRAECDVSNRECDVSNRKCDVSNRKCDVSNRKCDVSDRECDVSNREWNVSNREWNVSNREWNVSNRECDVSNWKSGSGSCLNGRCRWFWPAGRGWPGSAPRF